MKRWFESSHFHVLKEDDVKKDEENPELFEVQDDPGTVQDRMGVYQ